MRLSICINSIVRLYGTAPTHVRAYQGFTFRRKGEPLLLDSGTVNTEFAVSDRRGAWTSIAVDIARAEPGESDEAAAEKIWGAVREYPKAGSHRLGAVASTVLCDHVAGAGARAARQPDLKTLRNIWQWCVRGAPHRIL
jgi:hypothetical protein